ncbi:MULTISPECIES: CC/Se motif family (seleno)protein [Geobacillus]|mgnify:FL=1|jgi:hypothetical protein|uniref:CC/Se motif family (seleno)protein n=1 Tax=Geobacillus TaxID=129337 RepID=UPI00017E6B6A|nr:MULTISPECIES: CC/Se motif family (seleno)protein [Geobacillus]ARA97845.1 hypothetical protein GD3902_07090 [Geobacillus thermodenitrificans]ARP41395.1 hypothetical protein GTHT12_03470 [Geobacillus thermodenitrificans]MEC5189227.1 hypothetical protein [Geobacillus thermodenitrificans]MED0664377.1 hypothetical protein [Geobacillus thermodenitrificans]NNU88574.1 hypothetical protein [Geobacillus sp. MR]
MDYSISIDDNARKWLRKKGSVLTISKFQATHCCVPASEVWVEFQRPENENLYKKIVQHGITCFIEKGLEFKQNHLKVKLTGPPFFKTIRVEGLKYF